MTLMLAGPIHIRRPGREARRPCFQGLMVARYSFRAKHSTEGVTWGRSRRRWQAVWRPRVPFSDRISLRKSVPGAATPIVSAHGLISAAARQDGRAMALGRTDRRNVGFRWQPARRGLHDAHRIGWDAVVGKVRRRVSARA